jgi:hypothetical protein
MSDREAFGNGKFINPDNYVQDGDCCLIRRDGRAGSFGIFALRAAQDEIFYRGGRKMHLRRLLCVYSDLASGGEVAEDISFRHSFCILSAALFAFRDEFLIHGSET